MSGAGQPIPIGAGGIAGLYSLDREAGWAYAGAWEEDHGPAACCEWQSSWGLGSPTPGPPAWIAHKHNAAPPPAAGEWLRTALLHLAGLGGARTSPPPDAHHVVPRCHHQSPEVEQRNSGSGSGTRLRHRWTARSSTRFGARRLLECRGVVRCCSAQEQELGPVQLEASVRSACSVALRRHCR